MGEPTQPIRNEDLKAFDIPSSTSPWDQIKRFAGSFNAYDVPEAERYSKLSDETRRDFLAGRKMALDRLSLSELRAVLFLHWRAIRHAYCGAEPSPPETAYTWELIEAIKRKV